MSILNLDDIPYEEDRVLISDAINLCSHNFFRASYIMAWLGCLESLKRRINEIAKKDCETAKAQGKIQQAEENHKSIDLLLIESARNINLIDDVDEQKLKYFYTMRCVYSHPYEIAPTKLDCEHVISSIIKIVLSQPLLLRKGPLSSILEKFTMEESFLNDDEGEITSYLSDLKERTDPSYIKYIWEKIFKSFKAMPKENIGTKLHNRCLLALQALVRTAGFNSFFEKEEDITNFVIEEKNCSAWILSPVDIYTKMPDDVKAVFFRVLQEIGRHPLLNYYYEKNLLDDNQKISMMQYVKDLSVNDQCNYCAELTIECVINRLKTHDWYKQNDAFRIINAGKFYKTITKCKPEQRILLGRNILQAAEGSAKEAVSFIQNFTNNYQKYGVDIARGLIFECFFNEQNQLRHKACCFMDVEKMVEEIPTADSSIILNELKQMIPQCVLKYKNDSFSIDQSSPFASLKTLLP